MQLIVKQLETGAQIHGTVTEDEYMDTQKEGCWERGDGGGGEHTRD